MQPAKDEQAIERIVINNASPELKKRMQEWLDENREEMYWDYHSEFSKDDIDNLLLGDTDTVLDSWAEACQEEIWRLEDEAVTWCISEYADELFAGISESDQEGIDLVDLGRGLDLYGSVSMNLDRLDSNTRPTLTLDLGPDHTNFGFGYRYEYEDLEEVLTFFNINPFAAQRTISKWIRDWGWMMDNFWPCMPERNGNELASIKDILRSISEMPYSGVYLALCTADLFPISLTIRDAKESGNTDKLYATIPAGTPIMIHDSWNGATSLEFILKKSVKVKLEGNMQLMRDGAHGYGVDDVCGLVSEVWDSEVTVEVLADEQQ